ncbi:hypothetical protein [Microbacterium sp. A94]|uniref:hypothetical protein n=1 Tax=Microbacterium sp. A94 TaxID=3450717 RepID=UPI003F442DE0
MSDVREVTEWHKVNADLARRRELVAMTKPELISYIISIENNLAALSDRIDRLAEL